MGKANTLLSDEGSGLFVKFNQDYACGDGQHFRLRYHAATGPHEAALLTEKQADKVLTQKRFTGFIKIPSEPWLVARKIAKQLGFEQYLRYRNIEDTYVHLIQLGLQATEAQRCLTAVTEKHGLTLTSEDYIKLALNHSK